MILRLDEQYRRRWQVTQQNSAFNLGLHDVTVYLIAQVGMRHKHRVGEGVYHHLDCLTSRQVTNYPSPILRRKKLHFVTEMYLEAGAQASRIGPRRGNRVPRKQPIEVNDIEPIGQILNIELESQSNRIFFIQAGSNGSVN